MATEGAPVRVMAGGGPRLFGDSGSSAVAEVLSRRRAELRGAPELWLRGLERSSGRVGGGRTWGGALRFRLAVCGARRWLWGAVGVRRQKVRVSFLPQRGRKSSADSLCAPLARPSSLPAA